MVQKDLVTARYNAVVISIYGNLCLWTFLVCNKRKKMHPYIFILQSSRVEHYPNDRMAEIKDMTNRMILFWIPSPELPFPPLGVVEVVVVLEVVVDAVVVVVVVVVTTLSNVLQPSVSQTQTLMSNYCKNAKLSECMNETYARIVSFKVSRNFELNILLLWWYIGWYYRFLCMCKSIRLESVP